jgi:hypothetical protein
MRFGNKCDQVIGADERCEDDERERHTALEFEVVAPERPEGNNNALKVTTAIPMSKNPISRCHPAAGPQALPLATASGRKIWPTADPTSTQATASK